VFPGKLIVKNKFLRAKTLDLNFAAIFGGKNLH
jgi:hypothetical protein